jgi:hypothetical protein
MTAEEQIRELLAEKAVLEYRIELYEEDLGFAWRVAAEVAEALRLMGCPDEPWGCDCIRCSALAKYNARHASL